MPVSRTLAAVSRVCPLRYSTFRGLAMAYGSGSIQGRCSSALPCLLSSSCHVATPDPLPLFANRCCPGTRSSDGRAYCSCSTMSPPSPQPLTSAWSGVALRDLGAAVALSKSLGCSGGCRTVVLSRDGSGPSLPDRPRVLLRGWSLLPLLLFLHP